MNTVTPLLTDLTMMSAMRIAEHGRTVARVTAEVALSKVTGEYLAGFAHDLNRFERERVVREIDLDLNEQGQTRCYVVCEATDQHRDYLLSYAVLYYNDHARVEFTLTAATPPPLHNSSTEGVNRPF